MTCADKVAFKRKIDALISGSRSLRWDPADTNQFRAYRCEVCRKWHLTKKGAR